MNDIYDILEACLQGLENGADLETLLERYPEHAIELRPALKASIQARKMAGPAPASESMRRSRAKFMRRAAELREGKARPQARVIPAVQRLAISLALVALFLLTGTGLVRASSAALPGENLYPVKRSWEGLRWIFTFDDSQRSLLENEFESERLDEVNDLISEGRYETIRFAGVFMEVNGSTYVSGIQVLISDKTQLPAQELLNGAAVVVTGHTNSSGFVEVEAIELLPDGSAVPVGNPIQIESESGSEDGSNSPSSGTGSGSGDEAEQNNSGKGGESGSTTFQIDGTVDSVSGDLIVVDGQSGDIAGAEIDGVLEQGVKVEMEGYFTQDGIFIVKKIKVEESDSDGGGKESESGSGSNSGSDSSGSGSSGGDEGDHSSSGGGGESDDDDDD